MKSHSSCSKSIKAIDKGAVHRICSGQVVLNLAIAVKELVENSLDAGATVIDIRLREYGSELIEVTDNGIGVESTNFQALTLKHHTSKLEHFGDLVSVETFGFRGEALSSLCSLSDLSVTTRHVSSDCGTRLVFDHDGMITSSTPVARQVGTTVTLENIFSTLPVRHKEFHRNLKREFSKMTQLLYAYCLIATGVKITCTNQTKKGSKMSVACTQGCKTTRENIACVFGTKQLTSLLEIRKVPPDAEVLEQLNLKGTSVEEALSMFAIEGFISSCAHGSGRSASDRQFYFVNSRPCEPSKVMRAVNEVYHQYNMHQQPFVFLNINSARDSVDVNVTPDKRQVFMEHEKLLIATIKSSLQALYENIPSTYTVNNLSQPSSVNESPSARVTSPMALLSQWRHNSTKRPSTDHSCGSLPKQTKLDSLFGKQEKKNSFLNGFANRSGSLFDDKSENSKLSRENIPEDNESITVEENISLCANKGVLGVGCEMISRDSNVENNSGPFNNHIKNNRIVTNNVSQLSVASAASETITIVDSVVVDSENRTIVDSSDIVDSEDRTIVDSSNVVDSDNRTIVDSSDVVDCEDNCCKENESTVVSSVGVVDRQSSPKSSVEEQQLLGRTSIPSLYSNQSSCSDLAVNSQCAITASDSVKEAKSDVDESIRSKESVISSHVVQFDNDYDKNNQHRKSMEINLTIADLRQRMNKLQERKKNNVDKSKVRFRAVIDSSKNQQAEQELSREISKDMFSKMEIIGQFNMGFIICKINSDLFIVDQHATDEKYNFETLQKTTSLSNQKLVVPQQLELTAVNEAILLDNINIFKANGFEFIIDEDASPTSKVKLTSIPISRNWTFGKEDIDELLFMLQDAPNTMCRPSRVRAMFASRACRKSVMIGTALSRTEMQRLITHMGEIEQPWNCPHGRPTMRHLINLDFI